MQYELDVEHGKVRVETATIAGEECVRLTPGPGVLLEGYEPGLYVVRPNTALRFSVDEAALREWQFDEGDRIDPIDDDRPGARLAGMVDTLDRCVNAPEGFELVVTGDDDDDGSGVYIFVRKKVAHLYATTGWADLGNFLPSDDEDLEEAAYWLDVLHCIVVRANEALTLAVKA